MRNLINSIKLLGFDWGGLPQPDPDKLVQSIISTASVIFGLIAVVAIIYGGFVYMTSGGDPGKVKQAKNTILYAIIGLTVSVLAFIIVSTVIGVAN